MWNVTSSIQSATVGKSFASTSSFGLMFHNYSVLQQERSRFSWVNGEIVVWSRSAFWFLFLRGCVMLPVSEAVHLEENKNNNWPEGHLSVGCSQQIDDSAQSLWSLLPHWIFMEVVLHYGYWRHQILLKNAQTNKYLYFISAKNARMALVEE